MYYLCIHPGLAPFINFDSTFLLDFYEPFLFHSYAKLRVATLKALKAQSIFNKSAVIWDYIIKSRLDDVCISETWINDGEMTNSLFSPYFPPN